MNKELIIIEESQKDQDQLNSKTINLHNNKLSNSNGGNKPQYTITKGYISGLVQADGSFSIAFRKGGALGITVQPMFVISQSGVPRVFFEAIAKFLGGG